MRSATWLALAPTALALSALPALAQGRRVTGTVRDSLSGQPVEAGSVNVRGTTIGANVRRDGQFTITGVPDSAVVLVTRSLGFKRREVPLPAGTNEITIDLARDVFNVEQVVITGQATGIERRIAPNAVAVVDARDLVSAPTPSIEQQLVGKVAGADIQQNSGAPGGGVQVRLRGVTSVNADAQPLYVVDGVVMSDVAIPSNQNAVTAASGGSNPALTQDAQVNRIADLNPNDIETIEILKGASAAAIYGGRASNGVVIITTKRGRAGATLVNLRQRFGYSELSNKYGSRRFRTAEEVDAAFGDGTAAEHNFRPGVFFDHEEELAGDKQPVRETVGSLSGGTELTQYFASLQLQDENGIVTGTGYRRESLRLNLDQRFGSRVQTGFSANVLHTKSQRGLTNNDNTGTSYWFVFAFTPSFFDLRQRPDGTFPVNPFSASNPLQTAALSRNDEDVYRMVNALRASFDAYSSATQTLRFSGVAGTDYFAQKNTLFFPPELHFEDDDGLPGSSLLSNSDNLNLNLDGNVVHSWTPSGGPFVATTSAGIQFARRELDVARIESRNLVAGQPNVDAGTSVRVRELRNLVKGIGLFAQEEVRLLGERLLFTAGVRADQSSLNADAAKLHYFPKAAASYQFGNVGPFSNLKLRAAWGQSGNEPLYGQRFTPLDATQSIGGLPGVVVAGVRGSTDLKPERQREIEGGVDASVLDGRASIEASVYQKRITDLLLTRNLPTSSGFGAEIFNGGVLQTNGVELAIGLIPIQSARADWILRTTFSTNDGTIEELPVPPFETGGFGNTLGAFEIREGQSATAIVGVDTTADGTSIVRKIGDANPDFRMSFSSDMRWGPFSLRGLVEWQQGSEVLNLTKLLSDFGQITPDYANPIPGSDQTVGERRVSGAQVVAANYLESASYVKVRELALSWDIPINSIRRFWAGAQAARLSISARNPFVFSDYTGLDPEVSNFGNQPIARNIDVAPYPPSRQYWFSLDFSF